MLGLGIESGRLLSHGPFGTVKAKDAVKRFIDATSIVDTTQKQALEILVINLVEHGLFGKMVAIYPMLGGTATTHKYNLCDPRDTNDAFRLDFFGGWTHSSTGATPNGINAYADTYVLPSNRSLFNLNGRTLNKHFSYYSRTSTSACRLIGTDSGSTSRELLAPVFVTAPSTRMTDSLVSVTFSGTQGLFTVSRRHNDGGIIYSKNNTVNSVGQISEGVPGTNNIYIGAFNSSGTPSTFTVCECAFASIGLSLNVAETQMLNAIVNQYQTMLGRNV